MTPEEERIQKLEEELVKVKITLAELYANVLTLKNTFEVEWNQKIPELEGEASNLYSSLSCSHFDDVLTNLEIRDYPLVSKIRNSMVEQRGASDQI